MAMVSATQVVIWLDCQTLKCRVTSRPRTQQERKMPSTQSIMVRAWRRC